MMVLIALGQSMVQECYNNNFCQRWRCWWWYLSGQADGNDGGSGGGDGNGTSGRTVGGSEETQTGQAGDSGTYGFGNDGGTGSQDSNHNVGGGGGGGSAGGDGVVGGNGGDGGIFFNNWCYSTIFGTAVAEIQAGLLQAEVVAGASNGNSGSWYGKCWWRK